MGVFFLFFFFIMLPSSSKSRSSNLYFSFLNRCLKLLLNNCISFFRSNLAFFVVQLCNSASLSLSTFLLLKLNGDDIALLCVLDTGDDAGELIVSNGRILYRSDLYISYLYFSYFVV